MGRVASEAAGWGAKRVEVLRWLVFLILLVVLDIHVFFDGGGEDVYGVGGVVAGVFGKSASVKGGKKRFEASVED
tara:strand:+ start:252 stop:476 length:225 start_codon:yes stop_codon:yes gene_type:complete